MKKTLLSSLIAAAAAVPAMAGVNNINYQAVIKDGNAVMANKKVEMKFELLDKDGVVYTEEQAPTTNGAGLVVCQLGGEDGLADINWGDLTLQVSIKLGADYEVISKEAVASVPTALYAVKTADSDEIKEALEGVIADNEETATKLLQMGAEIARIDGLADDFENMGENLDNAFGQMQAQFEEVNGQLENLNQLGAVVRQNETAIEELNTNTEAAFDMLQTVLDKMQNQSDATDKSVEELNTNTEAAFDMVETRFDKLQTQADLTDKAVEELNTNIEAAFDMVETRFDKLQTQADVTDEAVEGLIQTNEETATTLRQMNAEIARIDGLAADFENMGENLDNAFGQMNAKFEEVDGQLENLNQVAAVVRSNEEAIASLEETVKNLNPEGIDEIKAEVVKLIADNEETASKIQSMGADIARIDGIAADFENMGENLDNLANEMTSKFDEVNGQLENLNQVAAVARQNETAIEQLNTDIDSAFTMTETRFDKIQNQVDDLDQGVTNMAESIERTVSPLVELVMELQEKVAELEAKIAELSK